MTNPNNLRKRWIIGVSVFVQVGNTPNQGIFALNTGGYEG